MATAKISASFQLDRTNYKDDKTPVPIRVQLRYKVNGSTIRQAFSTGQKCEPRHFKNQSVWHGVNFARQINDRLHEIKDNAQRIYFESLERGAMPTKAEFKERILKGAFHVEEEHDLYKCLETYIENKKHKGLNFERKSVILLRYLKEFEKATKYPVEFRTINLDFYDKFKNYLSNRTNSATGEKGLKTNTVGGHISRLKMFLNYATANGWNKYSYYKSPDFKRITERVQNVYLTKEELASISDLDLSKKPGLNDARAWLLLACEIGFRYSDYKKLHRRNITEVENGYNFSFSQQKTKGTVTVPLSNEAVKVLNRYGWDMPTPNTNQVTNRQFKRLAALAGIEKNISTHTGRRTFATLRFYDGYPIQAIMKVTGHRTEAEFYKYLCIENEANADLFRAKGDQYKVMAKGLHKTKLKVI